MDVLKDIIGKTIVFIEPLSALSDESRIKFTDGTSLIIYALKGYRDGDAELNFDIYDECGNPVT